MDIINYIFNNFETNFQQYKIDNELEPKKKNRSMLQSNVPINKKSNTTCKN